MKKVILGIAASLSLRGTIIVAIGLLLTSFAVGIGLQPCGWLDTFLKHSGCVLKLNEGASAEIIDFMPDGNLLVSSWDGKLRVWRVTDGELVRVLDEYISPSGEALSPDGKILAVPSGSAVMLRALDDGQPLYTLRGDTMRGGVVDVTFSPDGKSVAAAVYSRNHRIQVWQITDGRLLHTLEGHTSSINEVAISPNGTILASGSSDKTVRLWQLSDGTLLHILEGHTFSVDSVVFSPDGKTLASGALDKTIRLWRVSDGTLLYILEGHTGQVRSLAFSPDGTILVSGGSDGTLRLWRVADGVLLRTVKHGAFWGWVSSVAFSPDGTIVATAQSRGPVRVFDVQQMLNQ